MSEEKLYIDDGELVYYINENEFIACDEIPMPMLEGIKHLQQKVEQLENEINNIIKKCKDKQYETNDEWLKKFAKEIQNNLESKGEKK